MTENKHIHEEKEKENDKELVENVKKPAAAGLKDESSENKKDSEIKTDKTEEKKTKKKEEKKIEKKEEAVAHGIGMHMSVKQAMHISRFIKGKSIDKALADLDRVIKKKLVVRFKGEIPHRKGKIMSGRYPVNASKLFIYVLKGLKGNAIVNGMDIDRTRIYYSSPTWAARPARRGGMKGKRANLTIKAREVEGKGEKKNG